jgi:hypothetical protein
MERGMSAGIEGNRGGMGGKREKERKREREKEGKREREMHAEPDFLWDNFSF